MKQWNKLNFQERETVKSIFRQNVIKLNGEKLEQN